MPNPVFNHAGHTTTYTLLFACIFYLCYGVGVAVTATGYTLMECHDALGGKGGLPEGHPLLRHAQLVAFASLVMLLIITLSAIAVMESDSALFEEVYKLFIDWEHNMYKISRWHTRGLG